MILAIRVTQEITATVNPSHTIIPTDIFKAISETSHDQLFFRDTSHEASVDSETIHAIVLAAHAHQSFLLR